MIGNEQHEGFLIRHRLDGDTLILVLEEFQEGFPPVLSAEVREITITGVDPKELDQKSLEKSEGDDFWISINKDVVEIGSNFMPEHNLGTSNVTVTKRPHDITDLRALYTLMRSAVVAYQNESGLEARRTADLQARIANFIASRHDRLAAKVDFFSKKDPVKAAGFAGMLALLDELGEEFKWRVE